MSRTASLKKPTVNADATGNESPSTGAARGFRHDVLAGLSATPKQLQPKYFYDQRGSELFDRICALEEYYPFQSELELLPRVAKDLRSTLTRDYAMVEFGAGSLRKVQPLLNEIPGIRSFTPIDISGEHLRQACEELQAQYPDLLVNPVEGDFCEAVELLDSPYCPLGFFPGSTIGNFSPLQARSFLVNAGKTLGRDSYMVIGVDTKKSPEMLHEAYNDSSGVTAAFNRNILERINRELGGDFDTAHFEHYAFYNPQKGRVEMHLVSGTEQQVRLAGRVFHFRSGESIHTENSYKYSPAEFGELARSAGWTLQQEWLSEGDLFATYLLRYAD
jgi:dimethylhistidine N-methyltransferase